MLKSIAVEQDKVIEELFADLGKVESQVRMNELLFADVVVIGVAVGTGVGSTEGLILDFLLQDHPATKTRLTTPIKTIFRMIILPPWLPQMKLTQKFQ